jgi:hypothetical protein
MTNAATGSANQMPRAVFNPTPIRTASDSHQQAVVWNASASIARDPSAIAVRRLARASRHSWSRTLLDQFLIPASR